MQPIDVYVIQTVVDVIAMSKMRSRQFVMLPRMAQLLFVSRHLLGKIMKMV